MSGNSYTNWHSMSDAAIAAHIGEFIRSNRLSRNKTQAELASDAAISRSTLSLLERGEPVTLSTLIRVLRVLDLLYILDSFAIREQPSPLALAKLERKKRKRARGKHKEENGW